MGAQSKVSRLHMSVTDGRAVGCGHGAPPRRVACSASLVLAIYHRAGAPSNQPRRVRREAVSSDLRRARGCAVEGVTLAPECHRWQGSRVRPRSASTPRGMRHITRPGHPPSRWCATQPATTRASRGRPQRPEASTWERSRRCHAWTRVSLMVGQSGMTTKRLHAAWHLSLIHI